jgi:hypothetical protein
MDEHDSGIKEPGKYRVVQKHDSGTSGLGLAWIIGGGLGGPILELVIASCGLASVNPPLKRRIARIFHIISHLRSQSTNRPAQCCVAMGLSFSPSDMPVLLSIYSSLLNP